ncbi:biotin carboxylase N-terminal domain-containing protein [Bifidobacterium sp. ESL0745]|uniref:ATP-binding protein n=1 Tax=Bifidobacterium sp. ESL0745 TaxID=2983226 RepID=UPI0023F9D2D4|nr:biotin carboxylase N-terminal domain-containing protein [Bifidobacterium sp. ESL0745]MDF7664514.1 biotin carboxylase N-terminal domain-containing protein [Bifidobacterium sp. ESL0745]
MVKNVNKLLVANRGEIALRVIRTAHEMGIPTVAIYAEQDRDAQYVQMADEAYLLHGDSYRAYMDEDLIIDVLHRSGADAVHPGYGYLSEIASFADKVIKAGATWIGPSPTALTDLGDKITARRVAKRAHVPPVPGLSEPVSNMRELLTFAQINGYPVMMKRTDGGGGKGITLVHNDDELRSFYMNHDALEGGDLNEYFVELFIDKARHVETQSGRDSHGNFTVYSTRDCTVQRRNQKLIEEAPAPYLTDDEKEQLERYSRSLFSAVDYVGLGTCEFMVTGQHKVYFLEVNPRLQVEHTVSEQVCGLDLVREQINIANGEELTKAPQSRGHAFELRITSEDPDKNLTPSGGTLTRLDWPSGPGIRIDSGVKVGDVVSPKFDSMMGKLVVTAQDRPTAVARVRRALKEFKLEGVPTPKTLFETIFNDPEFTAEDDHSFSVYTKWLERKYLNRKPNTAGTGQPASLSGGEEKPKKQETDSFVIEVDNKRVKLTVPRDIVDNLTGSARARGSRRPTQPLRGSSTGAVEERAKANDGKSGVIDSPMQAIVTRVNVAEGQVVNKGDLLAVLESMKMENYVYAPVNGTVQKIFVGPSDSVDAGTTLMKIDVDGAANREKSGASDKAADNADAASAPDSAANVSSASPADGTNKESDR